MSAPDTPVEPDESRYFAVVEKDPTPGSPLWYWRVFRDGRLLRDGYRLTLESAQERADQEIANDMASNGSTPIQAVRLGIESAGETCRTCGRSSEDVAPFVDGRCAICTTLAAPAPDPFTATTDAWARHLADTAAYGAPTADARAGWEAAAKLLGDPETRARVRAGMNGSED